MSKQSITGKVRLVHPVAEPDPRASALMPAVGGFPPSDRPLFLAGYSELCRVDLNGETAIEICGGFGVLAAGLAGLFPRAKVTGLDLYVPDVAGVAEALARHPNLEYVAGDAFDLSVWADDSVELVFGQASLHHLAHAPGKIAREALRVLKPGGRLVFIFEPLGHNMLVAAIRAARMARHELADESNVFVSQFEQMAGVGFTDCQVQVFNLLGYPMKALSDRMAFAARGAAAIDRWLFRTFPRLLRYGANCNLIFSK